MRFNISSNRTNGGENNKLIYVKLTDSLFPIMRWPWMVLACVLIVTCSVCAEPVLTSWFTKNSTVYARTIQTASTSTGTHNTNANSNLTATIEAAAFTNYNTRFYRVARTNLAAYTQ